MRIQYPEWAKELEKEIEPYRIDIAPGFRPDTPSEIYEKDKKVQAWIGKAYEEAERELLENY